MLRDSDISESEYKCVRQQKKIISNRVIAKHKASNTLSKANIQFLKSLNFKLK